MTLLIWLAPSDSDAECRQQFIKQCRLLYIYFSSLLDGNEIDDFASHTTRSVSSYEAHSMTSNDTILSADNVKSEEDISHVEQDSDPVEDVIDVEQDSDPVEDVIHVEQDSDPVEEIYYVEQDSAAVESVPSGKREL